MRSILIVIALSLNTPAWTQTLSVPDIVAGCKRSQDKTPVGSNIVESYMRGLCAGTVNGIFQVGPLLAPKERFCAPRGATSGDAMGLIVAHVEATPSAADQPLHTVILEALRKSWPCK
jgi:hypothetical protein